jgi:MFS family permease
MTNEGLTPKEVTKNIVLVASSFVWYFYAFNMLDSKINELNLGNFETLIVLLVNFLSIAIFAVIAGVLSSKAIKRVGFLKKWMFAGILISFLPLLLSLNNLGELLFLSGVYGAYFGLGMPATMGYFATSTLASNRSKLGGFTFLIISFAFFLLGQVASNNGLIDTIILTMVRSISLLILIGLKFNDPQSEATNKDVTKDIRYRSILKNRTFLLYFLPWCMFLLVNYLSLPVLYQSWGQDLVNTSIIIENVFIAIFAPLSGIFADKIGRKRLAILGFTLLGIGYAIIGVIPPTSENLASWFFYIFTDGFAWGIFFTLFLFTLWGDLAQDRNSEKFYVLGAMPYLFSNLLRFIFSAYISANILESAVFSFASIFIFIAVLPLVYAPETLSEKVIKDRELKNYIEKAQKIAQKDEKKKSNHKSADGTKQADAEEENSDEYKKAKALAEKYY